MINTKLLKLIKNSFISEEDSVDIIKIFNILTDDKKEEILNNWDIIAEKIKLNKEIIEKEKDILLTNVLVNIQNNIENYNNCLLNKNKVMYYSKVLEREIHWWEVNTFKLNQEIIETSNMFWFNPEKARKRILNLLTIVLAPEERKKIDERLKILDKKWKKRLKNILTKKTKLIQN